MKNSQHTPGPWQVSTGKDENGNAEFCIHNEVTICRGDNEAAGWEANARLIAAAPELLDALDKMTAYYGGDREFTEDLHPVNIARAAIAKAKGHSL